MSSRINLAKNTETPDPPTANHVSIYMKSDNNFYMQDSDGNETQIFFGTTLFKTYRRIFTPAELYGLGSAPLQILPALGATKMYVPIYAIGMYHHNTTDYWSDSSSLNMAIGIDNDQFSNYYKKLIDIPLSESLDALTSNTVSWDGGTTQYFPVNKGIYALEFDSITYLVEGDGTVEFILIYMELEPQT
jgi:hypothetical protein